MTNCAQVASSAEDTTANGQADPASDPNNLSGTTPAEDDEACAPVTVTGSIDLEVAKTVSAGSPQPGNVITYTVTVTNTGNALATGVTVGDVLPAGLTAGTVTPSQGSWSAPTWTVGNLVATTGSATLTIEATVTASAGTTITNCAQVTASNEDTAANGAEDGDSDPNNL